MMSNENQKGRDEDGFNRKRRRKEGSGDQKITNKRRKKSKGSTEAKRTSEVRNVDQLAWKKISLENDEFDDFEEIEGVDVEYVEKDGNKIIQFKVVPSSSRFSHS